RSFHAALLERVLRADKDGIPSNADGANPTSVAIANRILRLLGAETTGARLAGQMSGDRFEAIGCRFVDKTFSHLSHLRPGEWTIQQIKGRDRAAIARFEQYAHLVALAKAASKDPELAAALGNDYTITPDVVVIRETEPDAKINLAELIVDDEVC